MQTDYFALYHINSQEINEWKAVEYILYNMRDRKAFIAYIGSEMQGKFSSADCIVYDGTRITI